jgi:hypothetical protein
MAEFGPGGKAVDSGLLRIDLPRMNIKYKRSLLFFINSFESLFNKGIRKQSEITTA